MIACCLGLALPLAGAGAVQAAAPAASIVFPPDQALLESAGSVDVLGYRPAGGPGTLVVRGKDGSRQFEAAVGAFSVSVALQPGESAIELGERKVRVFVAGGDGKAGPGFSAPDTHAVDSGCDDCHTVGPTAITLQEKPPALCGRCHDDMLKDKEGKAYATAHPPADEGDCLSCHRFHGRSIRQLPAQDKRDLCFGCHDDFVAGKKRAHAPVAKGECTGCHGPHGAQGPKLLPATGVKLCVLCHADPSRTKDGAAWAAEHPAVDEGCPSCHLAHVADEPGLLKKPQPEVCAECHDAFPTQEGGTDLVRHSPVDEGSCAECHAVHGGPAAKLLAAEGKALCVKCHDDPTLGADGKDKPVAHPALDDGCLSCHQPHVAPQPALLKKEQAALCFDCHDPIAPPAGEGASLHRPVAQGRCGGCHDPHGAAEAKLVRAPAARALCLTCHKDPARTPEGAELPVQHAGLDDGCTACHVPHAAPAPKLLAKPQQEVCRDCHEDKNLNADGGEWAVPHQPVRRGLCGACHAPHGSREKALLVKSPYALCTESCHVEVHERHRVTELDPATGQPANPMATLPTGFPVRKDGTLSCVGCHLPHGSDAQKLWTGDEQRFCSSCHNRF